MRGEPAWSNHDVRSPQVLSDVADACASSEYGRGAPSRRAVGLWLAFLGASLVLLSASQSLADGPKKQVLTISEVTIVGRVQRPIAAVDVSRIQPQLTLSELKQSFTNRIERALYRAPF